MSKANESAMNALHEKLARTLTEMIGVEEVEEEDEDGKVTVTRKHPSPAALAVAAKFLKDNSIFTTPEQSGAMDEFAKKLKDRKPTKRDLSDAMKSIGNELLQ